MGISAFEFERMKQRVSPSAEPVEKESELHAQIMAYCRSQMWIALHGSMAHKSKRTLGEPDFVCILPGGITLFIECKKKDGKLSTEQQAMAAWMKKLGARFHLIFSLNEFVNICNAALRGDDL